MADFRSEFFEGAPDVFRCALCGREFALATVSTGRELVYLPHLSQIFGEERQDLAEVSFVDILERDVQLCAKCAHSIKTGAQQAGLRLFRLETSLEEVFLPARKKRAEEKAADAAADAKRAEYIARFVRTAKRGAPLTVIEGTAAQRRAEHRAATSEAARARRHG